MTKTGLVLEGGGMRGIYTAGVLDVFLDHNITVDGVMEQPFCPSSVEEILHTVWNTETIRNI